MLEAKIEQVQAEATRTLKETEDRWDKKYKAKVEEMNRNTGGEMKKKEV